MKVRHLVAVVLGLCLFCGVSAAQNTEIAPGAVINPGAGDDVGDWLYAVDVEAATGSFRCLGTEFTGNWWVTGSIEDVPGSGIYNCYLWEVDDAGTLVNTYPTGHTGWGWRDLAFDGNFLYGSDSYTIEEIDPMTGMITGVTIASPVSPARALAYEPGTDSFWTCSFGGSIYNVDRLGGYSTHTNPGYAMYGAAYNDQDGMIWWWSQDGIGCLASEMDPATATFTGETFDGIAGIAGGACIFEHTTHGWVLGGAQQGSPDQVDVFSMQADPNPQVDIKCNGGDAGVVVPDTQNVKLDITLEARSGAGHYSDLICAIQIGGGRFWTYDGVNWAPGLGNVYYTGNLADVSDTILDQLVPLGSYTAHFGLDVFGDGMITPSGIWFQDSVDFTVMVESGFFEDFSDGVADNFMPDGAHWTVDPINQVYFLDCPSFAYWSSYYDWDWSGNHVATADMRMIDTGNYSDTYERGMYFRSNPGVFAGADCYSHLMDNSGTHDVWRTDAGLINVLATFYPTSHVAGVGNWNTVMVDAMGSNMDFYVNGVLEQNVVDATYTSGYAGVWGLGSGIYNHDYEFDNIGVTP